MSAESIGEVSISQINTKVSTLEKNYFINKLSNSSQSACSAAYSTKLLRSNYMGPTVRVRRGSDNVERDFYSNSEGNMGTLRYGRGTNIDTWLNGSTGFVHTWYDQSTNARHVQQTTPANQPTIFGTPILNKLSPEARTAARGIYSLYRASTSYTGATIRIRRSTDNVEQDFYANSKGTLGTTLDGIGTSITEWLSSATAFVVTWHDQSGSGRHATQSTTSAQPVLNVSSLLIDFQNDGTRFLNIPSNTVPVGILNSQYTFVTQHGNVTTGGIIGAGVSVNNQDNSLVIDTAKYFDNGWNNDYNFGSSVVSGNKISVKYDGTNRQGYINGTHSTAQTQSGRTTASGQQYIGRWHDFSPLKGQLYFVYIFGSSLQDSDRIVCENTRTYDYTPNINYIGSQRLYLTNTQYPPTAMTAHSSGGFIASASSEGVVGWEAPRAFDFNSGTGWHSTSIYNTSGVYTGSVLTTDINGKSYSGEWLQLQMPSAIKLNSFYITPRDAILNRSPRDFAVLGSNNGSSWNVLYEEGNLSSWSSGPRYFHITKPIDSYSYYRIVAKTLHGSDSVQIMEWILNPTTTPLASGEKTYAFYANWNSKSSGNSVIIEQLAASNNSRASLFKSDSFYGFSGFYNDLLQLVKIPVAKDTKTVMVVNDTLATNNITMYHNGFVHQGTTDYPTTLSVGTSSFTIGSNYNSGEYHYGCINEVIIISNSVRSTDAMLYYTPNDDTIQRMPDPKPKIWINFDARDGRRLLTSGDTKAKTLCNISFLQDLPNNTAVANWNGFVQNTPSYRPTYYNKGGYSNELGYINFTRGFPGQHFNGGSRTFNIATNGGFTAVAFVKFYSIGSQGIYQRLFDFGNGSSNNNIIAHINEPTKKMHFFIFEGTTSYTLESGENTVVEGEWALWGFRYTASTRLAEIIKNGTVIASTTFAVSAANRTLTSTFIGGSNWSEEGTTNMQLTGLNIYDYYLSDSELSAVGNSLMYSDISTLPQYLSEYNNVVPNGLITYTNNAPRMSGLAAKFNGSAGSFYDLQDVPNVPLTYSFWFNASSSSYSTIVGLTDNARNGSGIQIDYGSNNITIYSALPNMWSSISISNVLINTWYHLTVTINTNFQVQAYLNSVYQNQVTGTALPPSRSRFIIGATGDQNARGFNGYISDFRVYDYILLQKDINYIYSGVQRSRQLTLTPPENYLVNHYNWYSKMTITKDTGTFTAASGGADPNVQYQLLSSATAGVTSRNIMWNTTRIQDYDSFVCSFEIYTNNASGDALWFFAGSTGFQSYYDNMLSAYNIAFGVYSFGNEHIPGIYLLDNNGRKLAQSSDITWLGTSKWCSVVIKYKRGTINTWVVNVDGKDVLTYNDNNNESWINSSGNRWGISAKAGNSSMNSYIRRVELSYTQRNTTLASLSGGNLKGLRRYPEIALNANSSYNCVASASSHYIHTSETLPAYKAFNRDYSSNWTIANPSTYPLGGNYIGSVSTTISGVVYLGEWLQIQLPSAIILKSYKIFPQITSILRSPGTFVVAGSTDGTTWSLLDFKTATSWDLQGNSYEISSNNSLFNYFRIITTSQMPINDTWLSIAEWELNGYPGTYTKYPIEALTSDSNTIVGENIGCGTYNVTYSSTWSNQLTLGWKAFNNTVINDGFVSAAGEVTNTYDGSGNYTGAFSTAASGTSYTGEWLQIQLPKAINLASYTIFPRSTFTTQTSKQWYLVASPDGSNWTLIDSQTGVTSWTSSEGKSYNVSNVGSYSYYRLICNKTNSSYWGVGELQLFESPNIRNSINFNSNSPSGLVNGLTWKDYTTEFAENVELSSIYNYVNVGKTLDISNISQGTNGQYTTGNQNGYSVEWTGYFRASVTGTYTFYTESDDWSYLWVGPTALSGFTTSNALVNNGGYHGMLERSGTITLYAGVYYPIRVQFGEAGGSGNCRVSFAPPNGSKTYDGNGYYFSSIGTNQAYPAESAKIIKAISNTNTDGVYYIINPNTPENQNIPDYPISNNDSNYRVTQSGGSYNGILAFDKNFNSNWESSGGYSGNYTSDSNYVGSTTTTVDGASVSGEWLQIEFINGIKNINKLSISNPSLTSSSKYVQVCGSSDNISFVNIGASNLNASGGTLSFTGFENTTFRFIRIITITGWGFSSVKIREIVINGKQQKISLPTYCLMNDHYDGGGWMMLMKGTRGTTFNYSSNYWTTSDILNSTSTNRSDGDAKYDVFNNLRIKDVMAIFPDVPSASYTNELGVRGGSLNLEDGWCWKVNNWNTATRTTALAGFQNSRDAPPSNPYRFSGFSNQIFSTQTPAQRHIFGGGTHLSANYNVRWGFIFNENGQDVFTSIDVFSGIGMSHGPERNPAAAYSAGDAYFCCGTLALNRSMRFELFGR